MVFSSITFLFLFLPSVLLLYLIIPERFKNFFLMTVSFLFYFWGENYLVLIIIATILINYTSAFYIAKKRKKAVLISISKPPALPEDSQSLTYTGI